MISTKHRHDTRRALARTPLAILAVASLVGVAACSSSGSSKSDAGAGTGSTASASVPAALASFYPGKKATGTAVKVGLINNEGSSPAAEPQLGDAAVAAAKYANDELGGIAGHPIQVDRCSENEDTASATACANKMVEDKVDVVVIGSTGFGQTMVPIITKAGIPYVSAVGSSAAEQTTANTFMWTGGFAATLAGFAKYSQEQAYKKVTAYMVDIPAVTTGAKQLGNPLFKAAGVDFTIQPIPAGAADATPQVTAGLGSKPDAVVVVADESVCTSVLKALSQVDPTIPRLVNSSCLNTATAQALGSAMNGVKVFAFAATSSDEPEAQLYRAVMAKYAPKADITGYTVTGYQGMLGLVRATAGMTGDPTPTSIAATIKTAKNVPLPAGDGLTFTCDGTAFAALPSNCSAGQVELTVKDGKGTDPKPVQ